MRTKITGGWVVGHRDGRHTLDARHEVVYEGDSFLYVGPGVEGSVAEVRSEERRVGKECA